MRKVIFLVAALLFVSGCSSSSPANKETNSSSLGSFEDNNFLAAQIKAVLAEDCTNIPKDIVGPLFITQWTDYPFWKLFQYGDANLLVTQMGEFGPDVEDSYQLDMHESWGCEGTEHFIKGMKKSQPPVPEETSTPTAQAVSTSLKLFYTGGRCYTYGFFKGCKVEMLVRNDGSTPMEVVGNFYGLIDGKVYLAGTDRLGQTATAKGVLNPDASERYYIYFEVEEGKKIEKVFINYEPYLASALVSTRIGQMVVYGEDW